MKQNNLSEVDEEQLQELIEKYNLDLDDEFEIEEEELEIINKVMRKNIKNYFFLIDYDDMYFIPQQKQLNFKKYDYIFIDEVQDLNKSQIDFLEHMKSENGKLICVGDRYQSIYGFSGAMSNGMDYLKERYSLKEYSLSVCYRCPKTHISLAKELVPEIESKEDAEDGIIEHLTFRDFMLNGVRKVTEGDFIICRYNAPLFGIALDLMKLNKKVCLRGIDLEKKIKKTIKGINAENLIDFRKQINNLREYHIQKIKEIELLGDKVRYNDKVLLRKHNREVDLLLTISIISSNIDKLEEFENILNKLLKSNSKNAITLSSIHKAKGITTNNLFFLYHNAFPSYYAVTEEDIQQDNNLRYVGLTRAKRKLVLIDKPLPEDKFQ